MTLDHDDARHQQKLLNIYRQNLALLVGQRAMHGAAAVPQVIAIGIEESRRNIARIKSILRADGYAVQDLEDDTEPPAPAPTPTPSPYKMSVRVKLTMDVAVADLAALRAYSQNIYIVEEL